MTLLQGMILRPTSAMRRISRTEFCIPLGCGHLRSSPRILVRQRNRMVLLRLVLAKPPNSRQRRISLPLLPPNPPTIIPVPTVVPVISMRSLGSTLPRRVQLSEEFPLLRQQLFRPIRHIISDSSNNSNSNSNDCRTRIGPQSGLLPPHSNMRTTSGSAAGMSLRGRGQRLNPTLRPEPTSVVRQRHLPLRLRLQL